MNARGRCAREFLGVGVEKGIGVDRIWMHFIHTKL